MIPREVAFPWLPREGKTCGQGQMERLRFPERLHRRQHRPAHKVHVWGGAGTARSFSWIARDKF